MSFTICRRGLALLSIALLGLCVPASRAEYLMSVQQVGSNVVTTGSGSMDLTNLTVSFSGTGFPELIADDAVLGVGSTGGQPATAWHGISGPTSFGPGSANIFANSGSGTVAGISGFLNNVVVATSYVSGTSLGTSTGTYNNQTISSLGFTPGTYEWTWGTGIHADDLIVQIGPATSATPLPRTVYLGMALLPLGLLARKRIITA